MEELENEQDDEDDENSDDEDENGPCPKRTKCADYPDGDVEHHPHQRKKQAKGGVENEAKACSSSHNNTMPNYTIVL